jgi:hypothetical protein
VANGGVNNDTIVGIHDSVTSVSGMTQ